MKKLLAVVLTLAMLISAVPVSFAAAEADPDLVAAWNFDVLNADNTVTDITGNGNDLILRDTAYEIVDGFSGKTFDFNGGTSGYDNSKHLVVSSDKIASQINGASAVTFTCFMKKETKGSGTNFTMFALNAGSNSIMTYVRATEMAVGCRSNYNSATMSTLASNVIYPNADDAAAPDSWMHVAVVIDYADDNIKIYADGVLVGEEKAEDAPTKFATKYADYKTDVNDIATGYFGIGGRHVRVDDAKLYKRALTQDEIKESIPAVMSYDFEEVCDGKIKDSSAHKMDITVDPTDTPTVIDGVHGKTIALTKSAKFPADTFAGMLYGAKEFAVSTWIKLPEGTGAAPTTELHILNDEIGSASKAKGFSFSVKGRNIYFGLRSKNATSGFDSMGYVQAENIRGAHGETAWRHIYIEADIANKTGNVYIDGVPGQTIKVSSLTNLSLGYMQLTPDGTEDTLNLNTTVPIYVDELKVYRRTLTEKEIARESGTPYSFSQTADSVSVECYPENISGLEEGASVIFAMYDGTSLKDCRITTVENLKDTINLRLDGIDVPVLYSYKVFILKDLKTLAPVREEISYTAQ